MAIVVGTNSYISLADAELYFADRLNVDNWDSKDDDDKKCNSCEVLGIKIEGCDNGDGTVTVKTLGQSTTYTEEDLDGVTPEAFVKNICAGTSGF